MFNVVRLSSLNEKLYFSWSFLTSLGSYITCQKMCCQNPNSITTQPQPNTSLVGLDLKIILTPTQPINGNSVSIILLLTRFWWNFEGTLITWINFLMYFPFLNVIHKVKYSILTPFTFKLADKAENIKVKGSQKWLMSLCNGFWEMVSQSP